MSNISKINYSQKEILGNFMAQHTDLAKGILPNSSQGRAKANQLWEQLTAKLNASGPPAKDVKSWRKVYSDQKQNVKSKFAFNKLSKKKTGGGPYEEKVLSHVEEQILAAAGIEVAVEGLKTVKSFGSQIVKDLPQDDGTGNYASTSQKSSTSYLCTSPQLLPDNGDEDMLQDISYIIESEEEIQSEPIRRKGRCKELPTMDKSLKQSKTTLLQQNLMSTEVYQKELLSRLDKLIEIKNKKLQLKEKELELSGQLIDIKAKSLKIKEKKHQLTMQTKEMEFMIRKKELEKLNHEMHY